jgi:hypothetical protein
MNSINDRQLSFRFIPNGRYSGRIGQIKSSNKKGDHTVHIVALPGETTFGNNYIAQHRDDILNLSGREREDSYTKIRGSSQEKEGSNFYGNRWS